MSYTCHCALCVIVGPLFRWLIKTLKDRPHVLNPLFEPAAHLRAFSHVWDLPSWRVVKQNSLHNTQHNWLTSCWQRILPPRNDITARKHHHKGTVALLIPCVPVRRLYIPDNDRSVCYSSCTSLHTKCTFYPLIVYFYVLLVCFRTLAVCFSPFIPRGGMEG